MSSFYPYVIQSREFHWTVSIFSGIIGCTIVYKLTGLISLLSVQGYSNLSNAQKVEWNNRGFSTFHAIVVAIASLYLLLWSDLFSEGSGGELLINRTSFLSDTVLAISSGYFLLDMTMILWLFPSLGGIEYLLHHGLSLFSIILSLTSGQGQIYIFMVLFTEVTTPFVNLRWYLDVAGKKASKLYICNGVSLFFGWLVARILWLIFFFFHLIAHFDQVRKIFPMGFYNLLVVPPVLAVMNLLWFWKITMGMLKTLYKAKHSR